MSLLDTYRERTGGSAPESRSTSTSKKKKDDKKGGTLLDTYRSSDVRPSIPLNNPATESAPAPTEQPKSIWRRIGDYVKGQAEYTVKNPVQAAKNVGGAIISAEKGLADSISAPFEARIIQKANEENAKKNQEMFDTILKKFKEEKDPKKKARIGEILKDHVTNSQMSTIDVKEAVPALSKSDLQVIGEAGGTALDIVTAGVAGQLVEQGGKAGIKEILKGLVSRRAIPQAAIGAGYGAAETARTGDTENFGRNVATGAVLGLAGQAAIEGAGSVGSKVISKFRKPVQEVTEEVTKPPVFTKRELYPENKKIVTYSAGPEAGPTDFSTPNKKFASQEFKDDPSYKVHEVEIDPKDVLDTRIPEQRQKLESVLGKEKVDAMVNRTDNGLPNHYEKGDQEALREAADKLGYKYVALSETNVQTKFNGEDVVSYAKAKKSELEPGTKPVETPQKEVEAPPTGQRSNQPEIDKVTKDLENLYDSMGKEINAGTPEPQVMAKYKARLDELEGKLDTLQQQPKANTTADLEAEAAAERAKQRESELEAEAKAIEQPKRKPAEEARMKLEEHVEGQRQQYDAAQNTLELANERLDGQVENLRRLIQNEERRKTGFDVTKIRGLDEYAEMLREATGDPSLTTNDLVDYVKALPTQSDIKRLKPTELVQTPTGEKKVTQRRGITPPEKPVGYGKEKRSRLYQRVKEDLAFFEHADDADPTYRVAHDEQQINKAIDIVEKDFNGAVASLRGEKDMPAVLYNALASATANEAIERGEFGIAAEIGRKMSTVSTRKGQEISFLRNVGKDTPVGAIADVTNARVKAQGGEEKVAAKVKETVAAAKKELSSYKKKHDWASFVESIKC